MTQKIITKKPATPAICYRPTDVARAKLVKNIKKTGLPKNTLINLAVMAYDG